MKTRDRHISIDAQVLFASYIYVIVATFQQMKIFLFHKLKTNKTIAGSVCKCMYDTSRGRQFTTSRDRVSTSVRQNMQRACPRLNSPGKSTDTCRKSYLRMCRDKIRHLRMILSSLIRSFSADIPTL